MVGLNKVALIGYVGNPPKVNHTKKGVAVVNFSIATPERDQSENSAEWHQIMAFARTAEIYGEYLARGSLVYLEGKLRTDDWTDDAAMIGARRRSLPRRFCFFQGQGSLQRRPYRAKAMEGFNGETGGVVFRSQCRPINSGTPVPLVRPGSTGLSQQLHALSCAYPQDAAA